MLDFPKHYYSTERVMESCTYRISSTKIGRRQEKEIDVLKSGTSIDIDILYIILIGFIT